MDALDLSDIPSSVLPTTPRSVASEEHQEPTEDERVNTAMIDFLMAVSVRDARHLEWSLSRQGFRLGEDKSWLRSNGGWCPPKTQRNARLHQHRAAAVIEVKPFIRNNN